MAGIEKVCEYSGEYPGWKMYGYKRDSIQIMPKYRKLFRQKQHTLYIVKTPTIFYGGCKISVLYYCLCVPELPGEVNGFYFNYTRDIGTMKRKLKRLLGCKKLNIEYISKDQYYNLGE